MICNILSLHLNIHWLLSTIFGTMCWYLSNRMSTCFWQKISVGVTCFKPLMNLEIFAGARSLATGPLTGVRVLDLTRYKVHV